MHSLISSSPIRWFNAASLFKFSNPLRSGRNPGFSMIIPTDSGKSISFPISFPSTRTTPPVGFKNPQMHLNITVFPEPLNPIMPWIFPFSKSCVIFFNTFSSLNDLESSFKLIAYSILSPYSSNCMNEKLYFFILIPDRIIKTIIKIRNPTILTASSGRKSYPKLCIGNVAWFSGDNQPHNTFALYSSLPVKWNNRRIQKQSVNI